MKRGKEIILVAHCILNQNSVVLPYGKEMKEFRGFISRCMEENIGIIQLPCPETEVYGLKRWGHVKEQFQHSGFINPAEKKLREIVDLIQDYRRNGYEILGIYGIKGSPSCGVSLTCSGDWCGEAWNYKDLEDISSRVKMVQEMGLYMEIFQKLLKEKGIELEFKDVDDVLC
ncbi:MAG: CD3072 family TudS-related putative desulfidase [Fusobacteriaceae bacterium]